MTKLTGNQQKTVEALIAAAIKTVRQDLMSGIKVLKDRIDKLESESVEKDKEIENLRNTKTVVSDVPWSDAKGNKKSESRLKFLNTISDEAVERNKKEKNIIIFGMKESNMNSITENKEHDKEELRNIFELLDQEDLAIEGNFRLNSKDKKKPKPFVVVLNNKEDRNKVLYAAKKLKSSENYKDVFI